MRITTLKNAFSQCPPRVQKELKFDILEDERFKGALTSLNEKTSLEGIREAMAKCYISVSEDIIGAEITAEEKKYYISLLKAVRHVIWHSGENIPECLRGEDADPYFNRMRERTATAKKVDERLEKIHFLYDRLELPQVQKRYDVVVSASRNDDIYDMIMSLEATDKAIRTRTDLYECFEKVIVGRFLQTGEIRHIDYAAMNNASITAFGNVWHWTEANGLDRQEIKEILSRNQKARDANEELKKTE